MNSPRTLTILGCALSILSGCKQNATSVTVPSLERPGAMTFACYSESALAFMPSLAACAGVTGTSSEDLRIVSFGLESTRGEVAVIDWQDVRAIDSNRGVPGFTFVRVGEAPSAILIPELDSRMTFVANFGSYSVQSIETASFVPDAIQDDADLLHPTTVTLPGGPTDLEYFSVGGAAWLIATLPEIGSIAQIPVGADGSLGAPQIIAVGTTPPAQVAAGAEPDYLLVCPTGDYVRTATVTPRTPRTIGLTARPTRLALLKRASGDIEVLATDATLPFVHLFTTSATGIVEAPGFATAVPTLDIAVTPVVPATHTPFGTVEAATEQYVYAIDAFDRSVLVVDVNTRAVLPVNVGERAADRVPFESGAIALEVATPGYDTLPDPFASRCQPVSGSTRAAYALPNRLFGVFVAAALTDGSVGFIDVYDLDAACRGQAGDCGGVGNTNDLLVYEHRHRPRIGSVVIETPLIGSSLSFSFLGGSGALTATGASASGAGPGLLPLDDGDPALERCPGVGAADRGQMFPALTASGAPALEGEPLICLLDDPAAIRAQRWTATFEGTLATAQGVRGQLVDAGGGVHSFLAEDGDFCGWGTLGAANVAAAAGAGMPAGDPEAGYAGDMVVITSDVPLARQDDPTCEEFQLTTSGQARIRLAFSIAESFGDHLVLGEFIPDASYTLPSVLNSSTDRDAAFGLVSYCFPGIVSYEIRTHDAFLVASSISLARHRVVEGVGASCTIDFATWPYDPAQPDSARSFRAVADRNYINPQVAFRISSHQGLKSGVSAQLLFDVVNVANTARIDSGYLAADIRYNVADTRFYTVDAPTHTVTQFDLDPITVLHLVR